MSDTEEIQMGDYVTFIRHAESMGIEYTHRGSGYVTDYWDHGAIINREHVLKFPKDEMFLRAKQYRLEV